MLFPLTQLARRILWVRSLSPVRRVELLHPGGSDQTLIAFAILSA